MLSKSLTPQGVRWVCPGQGGGSKSQRPPLVQCLEVRVCPQVPSRTTASSADGSSLLEPKEENVEEIAYPEVQELLQGKWHNLVNHVFLERNFRRWSLKLTISPTEY